MNKFTLPFLHLFALILATPAVADKGPAIKVDYAVSEITKNVYVIHGPRGFPSERNQGFINNPGFVITRAGVVIVDPGGSVQVGEMVLQKIAALTDKPVIAVFNTHIHGDHWLGNQAIQDAYPEAPIYGHEKMIERAKGGDGDSSITIIKNMTKGASRGTRAVVPNTSVANGDTIKIGDVSFHVYHNNSAHTDNDIMIEAVEPGVLFLGDNVLNQRVARFSDGNLKGQIDAINIGLKTKAKHFVPGHGPSGGREVPEAYRAFLESMYTAVEKYYQEGLADFEMKQKVVTDLKNYQGWTNFEDFIGPGISNVYLQVEAELF